MAMPMLFKRPLKLNIPLIKKHFEILEKNIDKYLSHISDDQYYWARNLFIHDPSSKPQLNILEEEELINIRNDRSLKLKH